MTRLFLRFYLGVVLILIAAWMIQNYVFRSDPAESIQVIERAYGGGARVIRDRLMQTPEEDAKRVFADIQTKFDFPIRVVSAQKRPMPEGLKQRLLKGDPVLHWGMIETDLPNTGLLLEFGPLPNFPKPTQTERTIGVGAIFGLAAVAIAILLRPIVSQLRTVEKAATAIAAGELSARVPERRWRRRLPLENAFNSMAERTETLVLSQRQLLQAVSHELRTPLARIRFATDLIETSKTPEERSQRLAAVDDATQELDDLVGELLTYVRLDSDSFCREHELIDLPELFDELIAVRQSLFPNIEFCINPESEDLQVTTDRASLSRAVGNLLNNAGRFARSKVSMEARSVKHGLVILIGDDGPGIPESDRQRVFEPFVRLDSSDGSGTGLGLALVDRIANAQGGKVTAGESPLGGAEFEFTISLQ